ncbi:MAG TPA: DUF6603 domain-containing protein [Ferruginibacter sp.]|nr:DUF6603 domain-containing protein [Ferruginibacter sp.]
MAEKNTISIVAEEMAKALQPLQQATRSVDGFSGFMHGMGWDMLVIPQPLKDIITPLETVVSTLEAGSIDSSTALQFVGQLKKCFEAIDKISSQPNNLFPATVDITAFKDEFPSQLLQYLIMEYVSDNHPKMFAYFKILGAFRITQVSAAGNRPAYLKKEIAWNDISKILNDPFSITKDLYKWGQSGFDAGLFAENIMDLAASIGMDVQFERLDKDSYSFLTTGATKINDFQKWVTRWALLQDVIAGVDTEAGLGLFLLPETATAKPGFSILPYAKGTAAQSFDLSEELKLIFDASFDLTAGVGILVRPSQPVELLTDIIPSVTHAVAPPSKGSISISLLYQNDGSPIIVIGTSGASRLEFVSISATGGARSSSAGSKSAFAECSLNGGRIVIKPSPDDADSFLAKLLPADGMNLDFDLTFGFDSEQGLYFRGSGGLEIMLPTHISIGPIEIQSASIALKPDIASGAIPIELAATIKGELGPLVVVVENIGLKADFSFPSSGGNLGPIDLSLGFKPPNGLGLSINAGAVIGGGYLFFDFEKEEYAGALELTIAGLISAKAIGLITTRMPDGSKGFSMLIIITAEFMPPFQLGYGFTLIGVGGLLGLNRTMLLDPLRDAVRTGAVNSIMFPQNVIANAPRIISDLKTIFPPSEGKFLVGPMGKLGWGTPTLISLSLGLIIEIPGNIAILGVLKIALPEERIPLIQIQVLFVGTIDFDKKMLTFDASLYESFILTMTLEGDMAVRLKWGDDPDFILTAGGFHPSYTPPPLALPTLRRMAINILNTDIARIRIECYQAVTSNTVQFGSKAELYFGFSAISIKGHIQFDALFQFSPFYFIIEISGSVSLDIFGMGVYSIRLRFTLEGPTPWRAKGRGSISFFFFDVSADFDKTWGDPQNTSLPDITILPRFIEEINKREQWSTVLSSGKNLLVSLRKFEETDSPPLILHPSGSLVVQQKLLPLTVKFDKIGNQKTSDVQKITISKAVSAGVDLAISNVNENFARAQYQNLTDAEKLSKPSFEKMPGGISISDAGVNIKNGNMVRKKVEYEIIIIDKEPQKPLKKGQFFDQPGLLFTHFLKGNSISKSTLSKSYLEKLQPFNEKLAVHEEGYTVAFQANNKAYDNTAGFTSEMMAQSFMQEQIAKDPSLKKNIHVIPNYELQEL